MERPDFQQCIKLAFDVDKNALRMTGAGGSYDSGITWDSGLTAITHIRGPDDEDLAIASRAGFGITITAAEDGNVTITVSGDGNIILAGVPAAATDPLEVLNGLWIDTDDSTVKVSAGPA